MTGTTQRIHLGDLGQHIGSTVLIPNPDKTVTPTRITGVIHSHGDMLIGLDSVTIDMLPGNNVKLWRLEQKAEQLRTRPMSARPNTLEPVSVPASELNDHIGKLAFVETKDSRGPHLILAVEVKHDRVHLTVSSAELFGPVTQTILLEAPGL